MGRRASCSLVLEQLSQLRRRNLEAVCAAAKDNPLLLYATAVLAWLHGQQTPAPERVYLYYLAY